MNEIFNYIISSDKLKLDKLIDNKFKLKIKRSTTCSTTFDHFSTNFPQALFDDSKRSVKGFFRVSFLGFIGSMSNSSSFERLLFG